MTTKLNLNLHSVSRKLHPKQPSNPPNAPSDLLADGVTESSAKITWSAVDYAEGIQEYEIYRNSVSQGTRVGTSFSDGGLDANTTYEYQVKAIGKNGLESELSEVMEVTTLSIEPDSEEGDG